MRSRVHVCTYVRMYVCIHVVEIVPASMCTCFHECRFKLLGVFLRLILVVGSISAFDTSTRVCTHIFVGVCVWLWDRSRHVCIYS